MIYSNLTMRAYEKFRSLLTKVFHNFNLVSEIDESLFVNKGLKILIPKKTKN